jgi:murein DD-endopeptidase MepM/ murein hydrolase activator NlpD
VPSLCSRALVAGCVLAGVSAVSSWAAGGDGHSAAQASTLQAAASSVLPATHGNGGETALRVPSTRADRSLERSSLASIPAGNQELSPVAMPPAGSSAPTLAQVAAERAAKRKAAADAAKAAADAKAAAAAAAVEAARVAHLHRWVRPNGGGLSSPFGMRWGRMHEGIDLAGGYGSPIVAAVEGTVVYAGPESGYGRVVKIVDWDGTQTWYGHMSRFLVKAGDHVSAGQEIAVVGAAGDATGPHLHFEVRIGGVPVDPIPFLAARGVRI